MEILKILFFREKKDRYLKNTILNEFNKNKNKTSDEEILYKILFKKLNIINKIE